MATKKLNKKNNKVKNTMYLVGGIILIILIIVIFIFPDKKTEEIEDVSEKIETAIEENTISKLYKMEERDRMEYYFSVFLDNVESGNYQLAYDHLYSEFKTKYFPTFESFEEYMKKTFSEMVSIKHDNIERNGDVYVLWIYLTDTLNDKPGAEPKEMNIVIHENDYNDFEISFSVI